MKAFIFSIVLHLLFFHGQSQSIADTKWKTYNTSLLDTITVEITKDTIYQYVKRDTLLSVSLYNQYSDTIKLADVGGIYACIVTDTGIYRIDVVDDTLTIDLLTDQCLSRSIVYNGTKLWRVDKPVGINEFEMNLSFRLYPNPSNGFVSLETKEIGRITIYNSVGQIVIRKEIYEKNSNLILQLRRGTYVVKFQSGKFASTQRLIVN